MKRAVAGLGLAMVLVGVGSAQTLTPPSPLVTPKDRTEQIIQQLDMRVLPKESGYWGVIGASAPVLDLNGRTLAVQSATYSLLTHDRSIRYLNRMQPVETDVLIEGGPVDVYSFCSGGAVDHTLVGREYDQDQQPLAIVPAGCWKAEVLHPGATYALMINLISPEFTTDRVKTGAGEAWIKLYEGKASWATPELLRSLIGPNLTP